MERPIVQLYTLFMRHRGCIKYIGMFKNNNELMAAKILTTLMDTVVKALGSPTKIVEIRYWTDSMTVLYWIQNRREAKVFARHRREDILELTQKHQWGHMSGLEFLADLGSRGGGGHYQMSLQ